MVLLYGERIWNNPLNWIIFFTLIFLTSGYGWWEGNLNFWSLHSISPLMSAIGIVLGFLRLIESKRPVNISSESKQDIVKEVVKQSANKLNEEQEFLIELINHNFISYDDLKNNLMREQLVSVYCMPTRGKFTKPKDVVISRRFPNVFKKRGFRNIGANYFLNSERNIGAEAKDIGKFSSILDKEVKNEQEKFWTSVLEKIGKMRNHKILFQNWKNKPNPFQVELFCSKMDVVDFKHCGDPDREFVKAIASIIKIDKIKLNDARKLELNKLVNQSSLNILILGKDQSIKKKILSFEKTFKNELGVKNFYDYQWKGQKEISVILQKSFSSKESDELAKFLRSRSKERYQVLKKLGVHLS